MEYDDDTSFKQIYCDNIFSLARQLQRYNVNKKEPRETSKEYYTSMYTQFSEASIKENVR
jgi:predicted adenine nucleotide alpha hydrolase (AANH) superfamily ATPase